MANQDTINDTDTKVFKSPAYEEERIQAGIKVCQDKLRFYPEQTNITKSKYCKEVNKGICWFYVGKKFTKEIFQRAAQIQDKDLNVI